MNYRHRPQCSMCPMLHMCMYSKVCMPNIAPQGMLPMYMNPGMLPMYMNQGMQQIPTAMQPVMQEGIQEGMQQMSPCLPGTAPEYAEGLLPESEEHHKKKHHKHHKHHKFEHMHNKCKHHGHHSSD